MLDLKKTPLAIAVQGYKGGSARTPVEAANTLKSVALANILDLVSEGPIVGLADGLKSVFLDETPVENPNGTRNFTNFQIDYRLGTPDQSYIKGFDTVENEINVGVELKYGAPFIRAFTNTNMNAIRVRLSVAGLSKTNKENGDINGHYVSYSIAVSTDNGPFQNALTSSFSGKTMNKYERDHRVDLPKATQGWQIRVTRNTINSEDSAVVDKTYIESVIEVIDAKLRYPNSAVIGVTLEASQFQNIPSRAYRIKGRIIRVPSNYDPETRVYTGVWNGTFKLAYTNNPAWIYYDLATHPRYGLGHLIGDAQVNKWILYQIGQYCDQMVPDGKGGQEPRFACNIYLQKQADAYKVLQDLATAFRGIAYWANGEIRAVCDRPEDPVFTYSPANVIEGRFTYEGSSRKTRYNVALVSWNDLTNMGRAAIEYVDDSEGIARYGIQQTDATAIGCTSQGQAQRVGRYLLATSQFETQTVAFNVGLDGTLIAPGKIILINDPLRAGIRLGGRVMSSPDTSSVIVDGEPGQVEIGDTLRVVMPDGTMEARTVSSINGTQLIVSVPFTQQPQQDAMWSAERTNLAALRYRVISVAEDDGNQYVVTAVRHVEGKFANADNGTRIDPPQENQMTPSAQDPVTDLALTSYNAVDYVSTSQVVVASWNAPKNAVKFQVEWKRDSGPWTKLPDTEFTIAEVRDAWFGTYLIRVRAVNSNNILSMPVVSQPYTLSALTTPPGVIVEIDDKVQENYEEMIRKDAENAQAIVDEALARAQKDAELAQADADEAAARAAADAQEALDRAAAIDAAVADLEAQIAAIDLGDILGAEKWDKTKSYLATTLVVADGKLYRAKVDVPANTEITNATYWEPIGNYAELVDEVKAQAAVISQHTTQITNLNGQVSTISTDVTQLKSRLTTAEGTITSNSSAISALQTNVTNLNNTVTANSSAITQLQSDMTDVKTGVQANAGAITGLTTRVSNAEGVLTTQGQQITKVQADLTKIGGDNLLPNASFEESVNATTVPTKWNVESATGVTGLAVSYVNSPLSSGGRAMRLVGTTVSANQWFGLNMNDSSIANLPRVRPDVDYVLSSWVRGPAGTTVQILVQWRDSSNASQGVTTLTPAAVMNGSWQRVLLPLKTTNANVTNLRAYVGRITVPTAQSSWIEIDNVMLQEGAVATAWVPSSIEILGTASAVSSLTATVTQQGQTITSQGNAITNLQTAVAGKADAQALVDLTSRVVVTENSITSLNSSVTTLTSNIKNIGGDNLLQNSSMEVRASETGGPTGWTIAYSSAAMGPVYSYPASPLSGFGNNTCLRIDATTTAANQYIDLAVNNNNQYRPKIKPNTKYMLSGYLRGTAGLIGKVYVQWMNDAGTTVSTYTSPDIVMTGEWQRYTFEVSTTMTTPVQARVFAGRLFCPTVGTAFFLELDNILFQEGEVATNWTPSANEVASTANAAASAITSLTTRVTSAEGTITSQGGQITTLNNNVAGITMMGDNWMLNSNFATGLEFWATGAGTGNSIVWGAASGQSGAGVVMTRGGATSPSMTGRNGLWSPVPGDRMRSFRMVFIAKLMSGTSASVTARMRVRTTNTDYGPAIGESNNDQVTVITSTEWVRYVVNFSPALAGRNEFMFQIFQTTTGSAVAFDRIEVYDMTEQVAGEATASAVTSLTTRVTAAEGSITSTSQNLTALSNRVSVMQNGSTSIWSQGTFEIYADNEVVSGASQGTTFIAKTAAARNGTRGLEINVAAQLGAPYNADLYIGQYVPVSGARKIYVEFWAKLADTSIDAPTGVFGFGVNTQSETGANNWPRTNTAISTLSKTAWTKISGYLTLNANAARMRIFASVPGTGSSGDRQVGTVIYVDDVIWMDVTDAAAAQASTDALSTALTSLSSTVTNQGSTIASQGNSITNLDNKLLGVRNLGNNLIPNSDFLVNPFLQNWWRADQGNSDPLNSITWSGSYGDGKSGVRIVRGSTTNPPFIETGSTTKSGAAAAGWFPAAAGTVFRITIRARLVTGNGNVLFRTYRKMQDGTVTSYTDTYVPNGGVTSTSWADYSVDVAAQPANTLGVFLRVYIHTQNGTVDFDKIEMRDVTGEVAANAAASAVSSLSTRVTAVEGTLTSQGTAITALQSSIAGVRGGKNMISNGLFDLGGDVGWTIASGTWTFPAEGRNNSLCVKRVGPGTNVAHTLRANADASTPVTPGKTYRVSAWYKNDAAWNGSAGNSKIRLADQGGNLLNTVGNIWFAPNKTDWTYMEGLYTVPSTAGSTVTGLRMTIVLDNAAGTIWIDDVWMEEVSGEVANSSAITTLQTTVTQQGNTITAQGLSITSLTSSVAGKADVSIVNSLETKVNAGIDSSGNLLRNASFMGQQGTSSTPGWENSWSPDGVVGANKYLTNSAADSGVPAGCNGLIVNGGDRSGQVFVWPSYDVPAVAGKTYIFSAYVSGQQAGIIMEFVNASGTGIGTANAPIQNIGGGGADINNSTRLTVKAVAPAGTVKIRPILVTMANGPAGWFNRWTRPMLEMVPADRTGPSPWSAGGEDAYARWNLMTDVNGYIAGLQLVNNGTTSSFTILADQFRIVKPGSNLRTEYSDGNWRAYDGNGVLRVRMGVW